MLAHDGDANRDVKPVEELFGLRIQVQRQLTDIVARLGVSRPLGCRALAP
jgi:hypothetical protein